MLGPTEGPSAVVAAEQEQFHLGVSEVGAIHETFLGPIAKMPGAKAGHLAVARATEADGLRRRPGCSRIVRENPRRRSPGAAVVARSRQPRAVVERLHRLPKIERREQLAIIESHQRGMPRMDGSQVRLGIPVDVSLGDESDHPGSVVWWSGEWWGRSAEAAAPIR
jgi:hypothetical protein